MRRTPSSCSPAARASIALLLCAGVLGSGCALLLPESWRGRAPIPLAGPIDPAELDGPGSGGADDLATLSDEQLHAIVEADRARLVEIASADDSGVVATTEGGPDRRPEATAELREIADRLPRLQRELDRRGGGPSSSRIRHPVIR
jgi:hypothetical protein